MFVWLLVLLLAKFSGAQDSTGSVLFNRGEFAGAITELRNEIKEGKASREHPFMLGVALLKVGQPEAAREYLEDYTLRVPESDSGWLQLGLAYFSLGQFTKAAEAFRSSLDRDRTQPSVEKLLGRTLVLLLDHAGAEQAFVRASQLEPSDFEPHYLLGRLYQSVGRLREAASRFETALRSKPDAVRARAYLATVLYGLGRSEEASTQFAGALAANQLLSPPDAIPHLEYGIFLHRTGRLRDSSDQLRRAVDLTPQEPEARFELARTLYQLGELPQARAQLEAAIRLDNRDSRFHYLLGRVCYEMGDRQCGARAVADSEKHPQEDR